ncbi:HAD-IA family hydrolase [Methylosinus sp. Ce-a6]|uniref:HAD-IA family hydrolase n=1 Tax=Methylosinus sp. Ce-a6 TaxID=2172005 RepID=UPI001FCED5A5|nr:HAD-IA family hydrolase [Methylosinus sp. Ce-a6]
MVGGRRMVGAPMLVFDLDGTLADTAGDLIATLGALLEQDGRSPLPVSAVRSLAGAGARAMIERGFAATGAPLPPERVEELFHVFLDHYRGRIAEETRLFPGAEAALARFSEAGFALAVCTNKSEELAILLLERLGVAQRFAAICGRDTFPVHKPDGRALTLTIERAGGAAGCAVMVGDSKTDIETARNAGVPVVAVDFGYTETAVAALGPDRVISHFDELWEAVASLGALEASPCT